MKSNSRSIFYLLVALLYAGLTALGTVRAASPARLLDAPPNGMTAIDPAWHALSGATVHLAPGRTLSNAVVVLRHGRIEQIFNGADRAVPAGPRVWDLKGLHLYPGLIDPFVEVDAPKPDASKPGQHWNPNVTPARDVLDGPALAKNEREALRKLGFTAAGLSPKEGLVRGFGAVISLADVPEDRSESRPLVYRERAFQTLSFDGRGNPNSGMGAIAQIRQTLLDAEWNVRSSEPQPPSVLDGLVLGRGRPRSGSPASTRFAFVTRDELEAARAIRILEEFGIQEAVIIGSGTEFRRLPALSSRYSFVVPLSFPKTPELTSLGDQEGIELEDLMLWEQAPTNPRRLVAAGLPPAFMTSTNRGEFMAGLRSAIRHGLSEADALAGLTTRPAALLGLERELGTIETGKRANLLITDKPIFEEKAKVRDVWIDGIRHEIEAAPGPDFKGEWQLTLAPATGGAMTAKIEEKKLTVKAGEQSVEAKRFFTDGTVIAFTIEAPHLPALGALSFSGEISGDRERVSGHVASASGEFFTWTAERIQSAAGGSESKKPGAELAGEEVPEELGFPFGPYGYKAIPAAESVLIHSATLWTSGPDGILEDGAMLILDGKIRAVGALSAVRAAARESGRQEIREIDAAGRHVTPGLIDCHSHTGVSGWVNEMSQAVTAEVQMGHVTNPDDINWYRQLAGGLTTVNTLHGSANPIGGQNQVHKLRWGSRRAEEMHFEGAPGGIKFALGENVKRRADRYPNTRMGVDALFHERFTAAREYAARWAEFRRGAGPMPRRDLELDALAEILAGERLVHCHSYRQDEILMFCRVAEAFGFKIGTFQHVLEGYKVAEHIREHAIGGSAFSDWWSFKVEVQDAIPYAGAIMHNAGVLMSFNSDSSELARRMNLEAAKAIKYGGLSPEEALKFVTINPARQLRIEDRVGSLEPGKDADFVIWSGDPLSVFSRCESTWIDGREYFSIPKDLELREIVRKERQRLITKTIQSKKKEPEAGSGKEEKNGNEKAQEPSFHPFALLRARAEAATLELNLEMLRRGLNPTQSLCGECGLRGAHHDQD
jgi:imidazolonepropionase-like amidohydrolase